MKTYKIPCSWKMSGLLRVNAHSLEEAIEMAKKEQDTCCLPDGDYIDSSFELNLEHNILEILNENVEENIYEEENEKPYILE